MTTTATPRSAGSDPTTPRSAGSDPTTPPKADTCTPAQRITRSLLGYGVLAGVLFEASVLIQGLTRRGFRIAHDDASLLSNGPLGWIQITTFLLAGAMTIAAAVGIGRAMPSRWAPRLIAVYGAGLIGAGIFSADPASGFGPGAPLGRAAHVSWHGTGHLIAASIGFAALIAACFVSARYFNRRGRRGLAWPGTACSPVSCSAPRSPAWPPDRRPAPWCCRSTLRFWPPSPGSPSCPSTSTGECRPRLDPVATGKNSQEKENLRCVT
jgi:hypothetical protein